MTYQINHAPMPVRSALLQIEQTYSADIPAEHRRELVQEIRALGGNLRAEYERELSVASRVADRRPALKEDKP